MTTSATTTTGADSVVENGRIDLYAGNTSSQSDNKRSFVVTGGRRADTGNRGADN